MIWEPTNTRQADYTADHVRYHRGKAVIDGAAGALTARARQQASVFHPSPHLNSQSSRYISDPVPEDESGSAFAVSGRVFPKPLFEAQLDSDPASRPSHLLRE